MNSKVFDLGSKLPYFNRAYVVLLQQELSCHHCTYTPYPTLDQIADPGGI